MSYSSILPQFCNRTESGCRWAESPFVIGDKAMATNLNVLVICPSEKATGVSNPLSGMKPENILSAIPEKGNTLLSIPVDELKEKLSGLTIPQDDELKCPECYGCGEVAFRYEDMKGRYHDIEGECPICNGLGIVSRRKKDMVPVIILKAIYDAFYIKKMVDIASAVGVEKIELVSQEHDKAPALFIIGDIDFVLMPMLSTKEKTTILYEKGSEQ